MSYKEFYKGKKVLITGHTGFKGTWMCHVLKLLGAQVYGYALQPPTTPSLYELSNISKYVVSQVGDIRDLEHLQNFFKEVKPEIVIHMAAQPIVRESYKNPVYTYETNVMGTVNVLECVRITPSVKSFLNVTTDKVYLNKEWNWGYRENEELNGRDPYSNSKACSELVTSSYKKSFFQDSKVAISTVRAGNVIGGGDFATDRIIPDCIRAVESKQNIIVRNPYSIRPFQHVLEPVVVYLMIAQKQYEDISYADSYNVGPDESECWRTGDLVTLFCNTWNKETGGEVSWENKYDGGPHEAGFLKLDCSKLKSTFHWSSKWDLQMTMEKIVEWSVVYFNGDDVADCMKNQIKEYCEL